MDSILNSINTRLTYIREHSENAFILKSCDIIDEKLNPIRNKSIKTEQLLHTVIDEIIKRDIANMRSVTTINLETKTTIRKIDELESFIVDLEAAYF